MKNLTMMILVSAMLCAGQSIDLNGKVVDVAGAGIGGVTVALTGKDVSTTTLADGTYRLSRLAVVGAVGGSDAGSSVSLTRDRLCFTVAPGSQRVSVEVIDLRGRVAWRAQQLLGSGAHEMRVAVEANVATGMRFVRFRMGDSQYLFTSNGAMVGGGHSAVSGATRGASLSKHSVSQADTLVLSKAGYETKRVEVGTYESYLETVLEVVGGPTFEINPGEQYAVKDTCVLGVADERRVLLSVRFSDSITSGGVPLFGVATSRNSADMHQVGAVENEYQWVLSKGAGRKRVYAEFVHTDGYVDTVWDHIEISPWSVGVVLRNDTAGPGYTMRRIGDEYVGSGTAARQVRAYSVYRPWIDFAVDIGDDSTFAEEFSCFVVSPAARSRLDTVSAVYRTASRSMRLDAGTPGVFVYRYQFGRDSAAGVSALSGLRRVATMRKAVTGEDGLAVGGGSAQEGWDSLTALVANDLYVFGRKEVALVLRLRGKYFGDTRDVVVSARIDPSGQVQLYHDRYAPAVVRDWWEFTYADDGSTINGPFTVDLNSVGTVMTFNSVTGDSVMLPERGKVWDMGGADVTSIDLVCAAMPDDMAATWSSSSPRTVTLETLLSLPNYRFSHPVPQSSPLVFPVRWVSIDPRQWNSGWYLIAIVTTDSFGNRGVAPFGPACGTAGAGCTMNPQHWRIVAPVVE